MPDFAANRQALLNRLDPDEAVLVFAAPHPLRNGDAEYRYRPDSDLYWLTGFEEPACAVFLRPGAEPLTMFVQQKDREKEIWTGYRAGPEGAKATFGADRAYEISDLAKELPGLLQGVRALHYAFARDAAHDRMVMAAVQKASKSARRNGLGAPETFHSLTHLLHELRLRKSEVELAVMRQAAKVSAEAHIAVMKATRPGVNEYELEAILHREFLAHGGTGAGYTPIVAGGERACVLHYIENRRVLHDGELLLVDAGGEHAYYTADITRTFPVGSRFSPEQKAVYEHVLRAQLASIDAVRVGRGVHEVHDASVRALTEGMVDLGLLSGSVDELIESEAFKKYYMHGTSHWLGLDVHDVGAYGRAGKTRELGVGMVLTVEPGLYISPDDEDAPEALRGIGIRIEDDVAVTEGDPEVLTEAAPKTVAELEALALA